MAGIGDALRRVGIVLRRYDRHTRRAAWWAGVRLRALRRELPAHGLEAFVPPPPALPPHALRGVTGLAVVARASCLERSLLLQRWLAEHGRPYPMLVGVALTGEEGFRAHAWLEGFDPDPEAYEVMTTVAAPTPLGSNPFLARGVRAR
jgi:hypothetical protein